MEELFNQYYTSLCYYSNTFIKNRVIAEDIVQGVLIRFWETNREENIRNKKAWLYTAVHNATLNEMEKQQSYLRLKEKIENVYAENPKREKAVDMPLVEAETARQLWGRVNELPPQCRQIIRLYFIEGLSNKEIAERLQLHVSTIKTQKQRGITYLRKTIQVLSLFLVLILMNE